MTRSERIAYVIGLIAEDHLEPPNHKDPKLKAAYEKGKEDRAKRECETLRTVRFPDVKHDAVGVTIGLEAGRQPEQ